MNQTYGQLIRGNRNFRCLLFGQYISELGNWFNFIAGLGLIRSITGGSPVAAALLLVCRTLPYSAFSPIAGTFVDRLSRRRVMIVTDILRSIVALAFIFVQNPEDLKLAYLASVLISFFSAFFEGAKNSATPNITGREGLLAGTALMFSSRFVLMAVGAAFGGLATAVFSYRVSFIINSVSFLVSAYSIWLIPEEATREQVKRNGGKTDFMTELKEGIGFAFGNHFAMTILILNVFWALGGGAINIIYDQLGGVYFAQRLSWQSDTIVAFFLISAGLGLFVGIMLAHRIGGFLERRKITRKFIGWSLILSGGLFALAGYLPNIWVIFFLVFISRAIIGLEYSIQETMFQRSLPDYIRGRILTIDRGAEIFVFSLSSLVAGFSLEIISPQLLMVLSGLFSGTAGILWFIRMRRGDPADREKPVSDLFAEDSSG
ncbi:MAG: MFS transporter [Pyrinomonadaceae bacterium]